ncbi:MAG TPA: PTS sugar transporter subunit IIA [Verrucomicrobiales bacterium]|jgi:PTS system fructose-specific IIC component|nr:PTS sugar transporter subunit IIA [Verrucomicrobiales bacterium]
MAFVPSCILHDAPPPVFLASALSRDAAIHAVVAGWDGHPSVPGPLEAIEAAILEREALMSTALPNGIAFPHARSALVTAPVAAFGRCESLVSFGEVPVWLIVAVATPPSQTVEHLQLLSWFTRRCAEAAVLAKLREASTPDAFRAAFAG